MLDWNSAAFLVNLRVRLQVQQLSLGLEVVSGMSSWPVPFDSRIRES
jgi:hypothetical protein